MSIPIHVLVPQPIQPLIRKIPKAAVKPLDANYIFQSARELEDYIKNDAAVFVGQVVLVDRDVYVVTEIGDKPEYHKLQIEEDNIKIDEEGNILK